MSREPNVVTLQLGPNSQATLDIDKDTSITDIDIDMHEIAGRMAWYGRVLGAARAHVIRVDTNYRHWRALKAKENSTLAEHKIKALIDGDKQFTFYKEGIAQAEEMVTRLERAYDALCTKADMLRSLGASAREEWRATGMATPENPVEPKRMSADERKKKLAEENRKRAATQNDTQNESEE